MLVIQEDVINVFITLICQVFFSSYMSSGKKNYI